VYCSPTYSSKWSEELGIPAHIDTLPRQQTQQWVYDNIHTVDNLYLAGGEPMLIKENIEVLKRVYKANPNAMIRVNTNLSIVEGAVFEEICKFKNVHWIVSVETQDKEFNYIRYGGDWNVFQKNLQVLKNLGHKITFNMLHHLLNYRSLFDTVKFFKGLGFHNNSFVIGALLQPDYLNIRHLPNTMLQSVEQELESWINQKPGFLLENGLRNMLQYIKTPVEKNIEYCLAEIAKMDQRRNVNSKAVFTELYNLIERQ
jgi:MoaA/NifB/PqqE/SkfB family radical SAM enzyme